MLINNKPSGQCLMAYFYGDGILKPAINKIKGDKAHES